MVRGIYPMINRKFFFDFLRGLYLFQYRLSKRQVSGTVDLLDCWERSYSDYDDRWLAYILASVYHETGGFMIPVREGFASTDAGARAHVWRLYRRGRISRNYAAPAKNGLSYYGRGRVQNTWEENYIKLERRFGRPFHSNPDLLLDSKIDAEVSIVGHIEGIWRSGHALSRYFNQRADNWIGARLIVNPDSNGRVIAGYAKLFYAAISYTV